MTIGFSRPSMPLREARRRATSTSGSAMSTDVTSAPRRARMVPNSHEWQQISSTFRSTGGTEVREHLFERRTRWELAAEACPIALDGRLRQNQRGVVLDRRASPLRADLRERPGAHSLRGAGPLLAPSPDAITLRAPLHRGLSPARRTTQRRDISRLVPPLDARDRSPFASFAAFAKKRSRPLFLRPYALGPHDVEIEITHSGICHSELHLIADDWACSTTCSSPATRSWARCRPAGRRADTPWERASASVGSDRRASSAPSAWPETTTSAPRNRRRA